MPGEGHGLATAVGAASSAEDSLASAATLDPRPKLVRLRTLPALVQLWVGVGLALISGGMLVLMLPSWLVPSMSVTLPDGSTLEITLPAFIIGVAVLVLAWTSALSAAALMRWPAGSVTLATVLFLFYPAFFWPLDLLSGLPLGMGIVVLISLYSILRWSLGHSVGLLPLDMLLFSGIGIALLVAMGIVAALGGSLSSAISFLGIVAALTSSRLFPVQATLLFLNGLDLVEASRLLGQGLGSRLTLHSRRLALGIVVVLPLVWGAIWLLQTSGWPLRAPLVGASALVGLLVALGWVARGRLGGPLEPGLGMLLLLASPYVGSMLVTDLPGAGWWRTVMQRVSSPGVLAPLLALLLVPLMAWRTGDRRWRWFATLGSVGLLWPLTERGWLSVAPLGLALSTVVAVSLAWQAWRRELTPVTLALALSMMLGFVVTIGMEGLYFQLYSGHLPVAVTDFLVLLQFSALGIGIVSQWRWLPHPVIAASLPPPWRRWILRAVLLGATLVVVLVTALALPRGGTQPSTTPGGSVVGNVALMQALMLLWDFALSGERFTNGESASLPQVSRVLLYLAYSCSVPIGQIFGSIGGTGPAVFSDIVPAWGLLYLGVPLFLSSLLPIWSPKAPVMDNAP